MKMPWKEWNARGICPELHFLDFSRRQYLLSPSRKTIPLRTNVTGSELRCIPMLWLSRGRSWAAENPWCKCAAGWPFVSTAIHGQTLPRRAYSPIRWALERAEPKLSHRTKPMGLATKPGIPWSPISCSSIFHIVTWARAELGIEILIGSLMRTFKYSWHPVQSALANGVNEPKSRGRHLAVDAESDANILAWIKRKAEKNATVIRVDVRNDCSEVCQY
jgi:hypothetical protein